MQKPTIAEILHLAADEYLYHPYDPQDSEVKAYHSCVAFTLAIENHPYFKNVSRKEIDDFDMRIERGLENMGLNPRIHQFREFETDESCQEARYAWLKFAAMIAEEQGV
jgi:hypothetical protein